jgi:hypothetical protein
MEAWPIALPSRRRMIAGDRGAVTDVEVEDGQRLPVVVDRDQVGRVEDRGPPSLDPVANRRRAEGVLDRKRLEPEAPDAKRAAWRDHLSPLDRVAADGRPDDVGGVDGAGCTVAKAAGVIGMRVGEHDRRRAEPLELPAPIEAPVDDQLTAAVGDEE